MAQVTISTDHDCDGGGEAVGGAIGVHQATRSACHGAILAEGGTDETGYTCTGCSQPTTKVMGPPTAHWTCHCGTRRSQVVTQPVDEEA
jgi:hypothetical protein